jgi:hypothetical protein
MPMRDGEGQAARRSRERLKNRRERLVAIANRAQENMNYVRTLLKTNQPQFAALLERLERELSSEAGVTAEVPASRNAAHAVSVAV